MLTLIATPIGNLQDISLRAKQTLLSADIILSEDTRVTEKLLQSISDDIPLSLKRNAPPLCHSFHKCNEHKKVALIIDILQSGKHVALVSDAGTPTISDPGHVLIKECHIHKIPVSIVPGPCAFVSAAAVSGFFSDKIQFIGFLPKSLDERKIVLREMLLYSGITVIYESPHRVYDTLCLIASFEAARSVAFVRELTKMYEEVQVSSAAEMVSALSKKHEENQIKGEIALVIDCPSVSTSSTPLTKNLPQQGSALLLSNDTLIQQIRALKQNQNLSLSEACQLVAKAHGVKKSFLYNLYVTTFSHIAVE